MITIKTPQRYINESDILKTAGELISELGSEAVVIGGESALKAVGEEFFQSLRNSNIRFTVEEFGGNVTEENINRFTDLAARTKKDLIIGIGGGRVLDLAKAVGEKSNLPVVTVPTIAATCAAWSALSIIYDEKGSFTGFNVLNNSPKLVLADTSVIAKAPIRYLNAGIGDTIVKWYEAIPYLNEKDSDISLKIGLQIARLALDIINKNALLISKDNSKGKNAVIKETIDAIIILAGTVGSINGGQHRAAIAHAVHNSLTAIPETHGSLHGEKVIFGLIVQFVLEGKAEDEIEELISLLYLLDLPITLEQLGISNEVENKIAQVANGVNIVNEALDKLSFKVTNELIAEAIKKADRLGKKYLANINDEQKIAQ